MAELYRIPFYGDLIQVTVTKKASVVNRWVLQTVQTHHRRLHKLLVGLDIEWLPCPTPQETHPVALLQLCVGRRCLLFQLLHADAVPQYLVDFLADPSFTFVGVGVNGDAEKLFRDYGLFVGSRVDLNELALFYYGEEVYRRMGLKRMAGAVLGKVMEKPMRVTLSKWDAADLCYEQVEYGCIDAFASFEIAKNLFRLLSERDARCVKLTTCHHH